MLVITSEPETPPSPSVSDCPVLHLGQEVTGYGLLATFTDCEEMLTEYLPDLLGLLFYPFLTFLFQI